MRAGAALALAGLALVAATTPAQARTDAFSCSQPEVARTVRTFFDALSHGRVADAAATFSPDRFLRVDFPPVPLPHLAIYRPHPEWGTSHRSQVAASLALRVGLHERDEVTSVRVRSAPGWRHTTDVVIDGRRRADDVWGGWHRLSGFALWSCEEHALVSLTVISDPTPRWSFARP
jgi:hypothetical protein